MERILRNETGYYYYSLMSSKQRTWFKINYDNQIKFASDIPFYEYLACKHVSYQHFIVNAFLFDETVYPSYISRKFKIIYWSKESERRYSKKHIDTSEITITI